MRKVIRHLFRLFVLLAGLSACTPQSPAEEAVAEAIRTHGGERFENVEIAFEFRDTHFRMVRQDGRYLYERVYVDSLGGPVREWMANEGTGREVGGETQPLSPEERARVETSVHSVVYFGFLPFRLQDPAVRLEDLGTTRVRDEPYRKVEVTFRPEGGGQDWEDRFVYWFHREEGTLDYMAYRYHRDGGGTRFRVAVNRREVDGLLLQDYENYRAPDGISDIADYADLMEDGELEFVSLVELEDVRVSDPSVPPDPSGDATGGD